MTESGLAYLLARGRAWLVSKGSEMRPAPEQVRKFGFSEI